MVDTMNYKKLAYKYGIKVSKIREAYSQAVKEAASLGQTQYKFIKDIMVELLDADRVSLSKRFMESGCKDFNEFMESLIDEEIVSSDFSPDQRPEGNPKYKHKVNTIGQTDVGDPNPEEIKIDSDEA